jgi:hypothetical protein
MKRLILSVAISIGVMAHYAPQFNQQLHDYRESSACIKEKVQAGVERANIIVIGDTCKVRRQHD